MQAKVLTYNYSNSAFQECETEKGEYFEKKTQNFDSGENKNLKLWFSPTNKYPENIQSEISKGTTLQALLKKHANYVTGDGVVSEDTKVNDSIQNEKNVNNKSFDYTFQQVSKSYSKLGNAFVKVQTDINYSFISYTYIQPQKCRINGNNIEINSDWANYNKKNSKKLKTFPNFTKRGELLESVLHIKNEVDGYDYYGIIEEMEAALLLNEKEYRRNNWQKNQLENGFKKDFAVLTEKMITEEDEKEARRKSKEISGDKNAGGLHLIHSVNEGKTPLVPLNQDYEFDYEKDDTEHQMFRLFRLPRSLFGIKTSGTFSVEQVESDYEQYLNEIEDTQKILTSYFDEVYKLLWGIESNLKVINIPPSQVITRYMSYLNEDNQAKVIEKVFTKYGIEL